MVSIRQGVLSPLRVFRDEEGSTSFAVMLSVVLVVALMAISLQVYWVQSSTSSVQTVADAGAMAGASIIAKVVIAIQLMDAILLSLNLVGMMLHLVVVITGIITVATAGGAQPLMTWAVQTDKKFIDFRNEVIDAFVKIAHSLNTIAPYLSVANAMAVVSANSKVASQGASYVGIAVPVGKFTGTLEPKEVSSDSAISQEDVNTERLENEKAKKEYEAAKKEVDDSLRRGYDADPHPGKVGLPPWGFQIGKGDFWDLLEGREAIVLKSQPDDHGHMFADSTQFVKNILRAQTSEFRKWSLDASFWDKNFNLMYRATSGELYHKEGCRFLNQDNHGNPWPLGVSATRLTLRDARALDLSPHEDKDEGCNPHDWRAALAWESVLKNVSPNLWFWWSEEVDAHNSWEDAKDRLANAEEKREKVLEDSAKRMIEDAKKSLLGARLTYTPPGSEGFLCAVVQTNPRTLPVFTMPAMTGAQGVETGSQFALSAAKVLPAEGVDTISGLMSDVVARGKSGDGPLAMIGTLAGSAINLFLGIWNAALKFYAEGVDGLLSFTDTVLGEFGGGVVAGWAKKIINDALQVLNITPPILSQPQPVLVNTYFVLDDLPGGTVMSGAKEAYFETGAFSSDGLKHNLLAYAKENTREVASLFEDIEVELTFHGVPISFKIPLPTVVVDLGKSVAARLDEEAEKIINLIPSGIGL